MLRVGGRFPARRGILSWKKLPLLEERDDIRDLFPFDEFLQLVLVTALKNVSALRCFFVATELRGCLYNVVADTTLWSRIYFDGSQIFQPSRVARYLQRKITKSRHRT